MVVVPHGFADGSVVRRAFAPDRLGIDANQHAGPAPSAFSQQVVGYAALRVRIALSSMLSARSRFSMPFSSSNCRNRWASETCIPPYFAFSL